jgi:hypothetical protein
VRGLKAGRYLVRIPGRAGSNTLQTTLTITRDRRIVPSRRRTAATGCESVAPAQSGVATSPTAVANRPVGSRPNQSSPAHGFSAHHHSGLLPKGIRRSVRHATAQIVDAVERPTWTVLAILFLCLVVAGGLLLLSAVPRMIREARSPQKTERDMSPSG